jgi:8-oxo-dGTP pyrophosphatase MutT (NUDIX family)
MQPRGGYGGYEATFPKGGLEKGLSLQANAIKEAYEETGLKVRITGFAGDHEGDTTVTRFYHAVREGGDPSKHEDESEGVVLAPKKKAEQFLNRKRDREVLAHDALFNDPDEDTEYWLRSIAEERRERALRERETRLSQKPVYSSEEGEEEGEGEGAEDEFKEGDHPRGPDGKWTDGAGGSGSGGKHGRAATIAAS